jgi:hypothetical protein
MIPPLTSSRRISVDRKVYTAKEKKYHEYRGKDGGRGAHGIMWQVEGQRSPQGRHRTILKAPGRR